MSDTPQNDSVDSEIIKTAVEINDSIPSSESGEPVQAESEVQVDEVEVAKQKANDAFNKQYGEKKQLERELAQARENNAKFEHAERERQAAKVGTVPDMPDAFDDDYDAKVKARDEAIIAQANYNATNQVYAQQQQQQQQKEAQDKQFKQAELVTNYSKRANELGISTEELQKAGNTVGGYGLSEDLVNYILADTDGALITQHLSVNPQEGYKLASLSPFEVGSFISEIKSKASALRPKTSNAPKPVNSLQGGGVDPELSKYKYSSGATFE